MRNTTFWLLGTLLTYAMSSFAAAPVAMRVEVEPLQQSGDKTLVAVVVQVSPEDRSRIGLNAIVRIELDGGRVSSGSPMRAVRFEDDGSTRIEIEWPPGQHDLRVALEDSSREDTGIWVGKVRIPDLSPDAESAELAETKAEPTPEPAPETPPVPEVPAAVAVTVPEEVPEKVPEVEPPVEETVETQVVEKEVPDTTDEMPPEDPEDGAPVVIAAAAVAETADPVASAPSVQSTTDDSAKETVAEPEVVNDEPPMEIEQTAPMAIAAVPESIPEEPPQVESSATIEQPEVVEEVPEEAVEAATDAVDVEPQPVDEPADIEPEIPADDLPEPEIELPIVEPLRSDPTPGTLAPDPVLPVDPASPAPVAVPLTAEMAARFGEWGQAESDTREFSLIATRGREPALELDEGALRLRVGGKNVPIEKLGGAQSAPLLLGIAVDVASDEIDGWSGARGSLGSLARRAGGGRGQVFVSTSSGVGPWGDQPMPPQARASEPPGNNVARLVIASLEPFSDQHGRTFLVVLTDGRNEPTKQEWAEASKVAGEAGVPILVIALWDDDFNHRTRKSLKELTVVSGGSLFLVQGSSQLDSAADRFGRLLDGSYALRFRSASSSNEKATTIAVTASEKGLQVSAPKSIR